jgi:hypothetical protein
MKDGLTETNKMEEARLSGKYIEQGHAYRRYLVPGEH